MTSDEPTLEQTVGERIREARLARGWSQAALAREADVSENTVLSAELGHHSTRPEKVRAMLDALGMQAPSDTAIDLAGVPEEVHIFLRVTAARLAVLDEASRARVLNDLYARLLERLYDEM